MVVPEIRHDLQEEGFLEISSKTGSIRCTPHRVSQSPGVVKEVFSRNVFSKYWRRIDRPQQMEGLLGRGRLEAAFCSAGSQSVDSPCSRPEAQENDCLANRVDAVMSGEG